ncbi:MAG: 16S rRNA (guanine(966)-N(2))-methyltransferase RsmD [Ignavibacteriae bacterium]|nr:16S rRNA (guanine(966)-N(2))-methyltransferase RsmD [Ignavibacteriota bacterium]
MRVITGKYKGRTLVSIQDRSIRPATDRVKATIFNMLQNRLGVINAKVLDLFAGSGSLGFEALSRGAAQVVFVDSHRAMIEMINENAQCLGCLDSCDIVHEDALVFIERETDQYNLIFADPPYAYEKTPQLPTLIFGRQLLKKEGFLIIEHAKRTIFEPSAFFTLTVQKEFGNTRVSFFTHPSNHEA